MLSTDDSPFITLFYSLEWEQIEISDGLGSETRHGDYRGRIESCIPTPYTLSRNHKWTVFYASDDMSIHGVVASGYCYSTHNAALIIARVILLQL